MHEIRNFSTSSAMGSINSWILELNSTSVSGVEAMSKVSSGKILRKFNNMDGEEFNNEMISKIGFCHSRNWMAKRASATFSCVIINFWL